MIFKHLTISKKNLPKAIMALSGCFAILTVLLLLALRNEPVYSDQTTCPITGTVTNVHIEMHSRRRQDNIYLTLENGNRFKFSAALLIRIGMGCEEFKNIALNSTATVRYPLVNRGTLATISIDGNEIINYDTINDLRNNNVVCIVVAYIVLVIFSVLFILLKFIEFNFSTFP